MNFKYVDVAIIGAGLAGVAAAGDLIAAGKSDLLIDKSRGVGGRMATRRHCDTRIDHGAQLLLHAVRDFSPLLMICCVAMWSRFGHTGFQYFWMVWSCPVEMAILDTHAQVV
jgi:predicted NAD/FAD-dependent oxidoreductase